jgi:hypothetical protein
MMFRTLNRWGHHLPGLRIAEPAGYIMLGVVILVALTAFILVSSNRRRRLLAALLGVLQWTWFCGLTIFHLWWKASFVGSWSSIKQQLALQTVPTYWALGCLIIWTAFLGRHIWTSRSTAGSRGKGFPVIPP